jgi:GRF zinc finger
MMLRDTDYSALSILSRLLLSQEARSLRASWDDLDSATFSAPGTEDLVGKGGDTINKRDAKRSAAEKAVSRLEAEEYELPGDRDAITRLKMFPNCRHGEPSKLYTVNKPGPSKGRKFFSCSR